MKQHQPLRKWYCWFQSLFSSQTLPLRASPRHLFHHLFHSARRRLWMPHHDPNQVGVAYPAAKSIPKYVHPTGRTKHDKAEWKIKKGWRWALHITKHMLHNVRYHQLSACCMFAMHSMCLQVLALLRLWPRNRASGRRSHSSATNGQLLLGGVPNPREKSRAN